jgi:hypothetical protein
VKLALTHTKNKTPGSDCVAAGGVDWHTGSYCNEFYIGFTLVAQA